MNIKKWITYSIISFFLIGIIAFIIDDLKKQVEIELLRKNLLATTQKIKNHRGKIFGLGEFLPSQYIEICFQPAYMLRENFEKKIGKSLNDYDILINDGEIMWWIFDDRGQATRLKFSNAEVTLSSSIELGKCFSTKNAIVVYEFDSNKDGLNIEEMK